MLIDKLKCIYIYSFTQIFTFKTKFKNETIYLINLNKPYINGYLLIYKYALCNKSPFYIERVSTEKKIT